MMPDDEEIKARIAELETRRRDAEEVCQAAKREINQEIKLVRQRCPHKSTKWVPDASGNNDSFSYCLICGEERKRFL